MGIIKSFLNIFRSGRREDEEERVRTQKERYDNFLKALTEGDLDTRWNAVRSVGDLGEPFIEPLIRGLSDEYWVIRRGSADTLGKIGIPAVAPLIGALNVVAEDIRQETIRALLLIGEPAFDSLATATRNPQPLIRRGAIQALGSMGDPRAVQILIEVLKDSDASPKGGGCIAWTHWGRTGCRPPDRESQ